jgi:cytochrome c-type biogenesis protein CcmH/NrfF
MAQIKHRSIRAWAACATVILLACATILVPLGHAQQSDHAKKLGMNLMCMCGCAQVLVQCNHINCPSSAPMLKELDTHIAAGESDEVILQDFMQEYGVQVLSSPPNKGFNRVAWLLPGFAFAIGLGIVALIIGRWRYKDLAPAPAVPSSSAVLSADALARAREKVNRETED